MLVIICSLLMAAVGALLVWLARKYLIVRQHKVFMIAGITVVVILFETLLFSAATLPCKINRFLDDGMQVALSRIEEVAPGATTEELGIGDFKTLISAAKDFSSFSYVDDDMGFVVHIICESIVGNRIQRLCENVEVEVSLFEEMGIAPTVRNVLEYTVRRADEPIRRVTGILEMIVSVVAALCFIALGALIWAIRNDFFSSKSNGIVYGEDFAENASAE